ncbi:MAG TPA: alcohol dehydrogenase catalytic domain-containing protein, partial [Chloroflexota bacterium]|nr:alcohol dehydrogenase catalytic domain-containing protein [Chloroflexota bacterium]
MNEERSTMKAVVYLRPGVIEVRDVPKPEPEPGEVLIRVRATGVCGSDMHIYSEGRLGSQIITDPLILGHEMSGQVEALGEGVTSLSVGQAAAVEPQLACGYCLPCRTGNYNVCPNVRFMGQPSKQGTMAEYVTVPAK